MAAAEKEGADAGDMILLISADGQHFEVTEAAASLSNLVSNMIEDDCTENGIPLPNVTSNVLAKVLEYCKEHATASSNATAAAAAATAEAVAAKASKEEELKSFDAEFIDVDNTMLFDLILAANYLNVPRLLNLTCQCAADLIKGKTVEQIRDMFAITNDFTPEEEEEICRENPWTFEN